MMEISLEKLSEVRVLVVGDIMLDRYLWGKVGRISPEAPVPVVKLVRTTVTLGGSGNVANNIAGLGCAVTLLGLCGGDRKAGTLRALLSQKGIDHRLVEDPSRPTITKTRIMAHKQQVLRLDEEDDRTPSSDALDEIKAHFIRELSRCQAVIISDYGKGLFASKNFVQELIALGKDGNRPVLIDPKGVSWERYQGAACVTPNTAELEAVAGTRLEQDEARLVAAAKEVRGRFGLKWLLVTRGAQGMCLVGPPPPHASVSRGNGRGPARRRSGSTYGRIAPRLLPK